MDNGKEESQLQETGGFPGGGAAFDRDWTKGNIFHNLTYLGWRLRLSLKAPHTCAYCLYAR